VLRDIRRDDEELTMEASFPLQNRAREKRNQGYRASSEREIGAANHDMIWSFLFGNDSCREQRVDIWEIVFEF
jgi:hypothetical protein